MYCVRKYNQKSKKLRTKKKFLKRFVSNLIRPIFKNSIKNGDLAWMIIDQGRREKAPLMFSYILELTPLFHEGLTEKHKKSR